MMTVAEPPAGRPALTPVLLQVGHRVASVGLLALLGTVALAWMGKPFAVPLAIAAGAGVLTVCLTLVSLSRSPRTALVIVLGVAGVVAAVQLTTRPGTEPAGTPPTTFKLVMSRLEVPAAAAGVADTLVCLAIFLCTADAPHPPRREAYGLLTFGGTLAVVAMVFMVVARLDVIQADVKAFGEQERDEATAFFSPTPPLPP